MKEFRGRYGHPGYTGVGEGPFFKKAVTTEMVEQSKMPVCDNCTKRLSYECFRGSKHKLKTCEEFDLDTKHVKVKAPAIEVDANGKEVKPHDNL